MARSDVPIPVYIEPGDPLRFPDPRRADAEGLVAVGGNLTVARLRLAYECGLFPWFDVDVPPLWWSPDPRATIDPETLHVSRSLRRTARRAGFQFSWNRCFEDVMRACAEDRIDGTWIFEDMVRAYTELHRHGDAHSLEVWHGDALVGGLYGVQRGALFAAESKFHRRTGASKLALVVCVRSLFAAGIELFDVQFATPHLASLGAIECSREDYLQRLATARTRAVDLRAPRLLDEL